MKNKITQRKIGIRKAMELAKEKGLDFSTPTIIKYCKEFKLGKQVTGKFGRWYIDVDKWIKFLENINA